MFYKVVTNGTLLGQDIRNTFYYRTGIGFDVEGLTIGGAAELAQEFKDEVWAGGWQDTVSNEFMLQSIEVYPINDTFQLVYSLPFILPVNETGDVSGEVISPAACVNIRFNLESQLLGLNLTAPKRGYVAIAGVVEGQSTGGLLNSGFFDNDLQHYGKLAKALARNIESLVPPCIWYPVRVRLYDNPIGNNPLFLGWADVSDGVVKREVSWRRSRRPE